MEDERNLLINEELVKQTRREYHKHWRSKNKDKIQGYNKKFWAKKALEKLQEGEVNGKQ